MTTDEKETEWNRRGFLSTLLAAATLDPERLLWVPGKKKIFVPEPRIRARKLFFNVVDSRLYGTREKFREHFMLPAMGTIQAMVDAKAIELMVKRPNWIPMMSPGDAAFVEFSEGRKMRAMETFDLRTGVMYGEVAALVEF